MSIKLVKNGGSPPDNALKLGHQTDGAGDLYIAVAHTQWGDIAGKAKDNTCWFPYYEKEHETENFSWVTSDETDWDLFESGQHDQGPPTFLIGNQNDGGGAHYAAVANTPHGKIPGKAKNGTCWYSYWGKEHTTTEFFWIRQPGKEG